MDDLEKEYFRLVKLSKTPQLKKFVDLNKLKELGDLLKYRRMKKDLEGIDEEKLANILIKELKDLFYELIRL